MIDDIERCYAAGWSDGLPVVPPYRRKVDEMRDAMGFESNTELAGHFEDQKLEIKAEHVAAVAVMSGCLPEYGRVLRALTDAMFAPEYNLSGAEVTTGGAAVCVIVSGKIVSELNFNTGPNSVGGSNTRVNATIGRYANMGRHHFGTGGGVLEQHGSIGHPGRLGFLIAERQENRAWAPFHTQTGLPEDVSAVSIFSCEGPNSVNNHYGNTPRAILDTISDNFGNAGSTNYFWYIANYVVVVGPGHVETITKEGMTRDEVRTYLYENGRRPTDWLMEIGRIPPKDFRENSFIVPGTMRSPVKSEKQLFILEAGEAGGQFSAVIPGWVGCWEMVTRQIKE